MDGEYNRKILFYFVVLPEKVPFTEDAVYQGNVWGVWAKDQNDGIERLKSQVFFVHDDVFHYKFHRVNELPECKKNDVPILF